ncbi:hypothetical protein IT570_07645 [Candidatus Sumerlaeota bacterium]|nr:hypothetical protein [Candidatus Sumerlaeota bacterium]
MTFSRAIFLWFAHVVLLVTAGRLPADTIVYLMPDGSTKTFPGVIVEKGLRNPDGTYWLQVRFPDGQSHAVEMARVQRIEFGDRGEGRKFNIRVGSGLSPNEIYNESTIFKYDQARFEAMPPEESEHYLLTVEHLNTFELTVPLPSPLGATPPPVEQSDDLLAESPSGAPFTSGDAETGDGNDDEDDSSPRIGSSRFGGSPLSGFADGPSGPAGIALKILYGLVSIITMVTWIWLLIYLFSQGEIMNAVFLILCGCLFLKYYFATRYDGSHRAVLMGLLLAEFVGSAIYIIGMVVAG